MGLGLRFGLGFGLGFGLELPSPPKPLTVHAQRVSATKWSRSIMYARRARSRSSALAASASGDVATAATRLMLRSPGEGWG